MKAKMLPFILLIFILITACSRTGKESKPGAEIRTENEILRQFYSGSVWSALALLETGESPLWFELGPGGPLLIESPETATLSPYSPWPHARFVAGILAWDDFLVMAINREGFFVLGAAPASLSSGAKTRTVLYRIAEDDLWYPYTVESFFIWKGKPAALLYRHDFFAEPYASSPQPQVFVLDKYSSVPLGARIPALERFPPGDSWEAEVLRRGPDDFWYYRMKEKGQIENETAYFRARDLEGEGERISQTEWRNSDLPEGPENIPLILSNMLESAVKLGLEGTGPVLALRVISPDFEGSRLFRSASSVGGGENQAFLYVYCRENPEPVALAILPDGRGLYVHGKEQNVRPFSLPALPDDFVYTGVALLGDIVLASWEEQEGAGIGAAGFMVCTVFGK